MLGSFKRSVIWNECKSKIQTVSTIPAEGGNIDSKRILLNSSFQRVNRLFVMGFNTNTVKRNTDDAESHRRYFLPRIEIKDYNVLIDERSFDDQNINDSITRYNELLKLTTGKSEDYTTGCLIDHDYYINDYNIAAVDLSHQAILNLDPKSIQAGQHLRAQILTVLEFSKGTVKVY